MGTSVGTSYPRLLTIGTLQQKAKPSFAIFKVSFSLKKFAIVAAYIYINHLLYQCTAKLVMIKCSFIQKFSNDQIPSCN